MRPRGGPPPAGSAALLLLLLVASVRLYGALLVLYPEAFRRRYSEEMRRDFRELMLEGLQEGGANELVRVWVRAFSDLVLTVLEESDTKEKELLVALDRRGKLTAAEAVLESSLSVEEAERMLVVRGHLDVTIEHGKLVYSSMGKHRA